MRGLRLELLLAGTAVAALLAGPTVPALAQAASEPAAQTAGAAPAQTAPAATAATPAPAAPAEIATAEPAKTAPAETAAPAPAATEAATPAPAAPAATATAAPAPAKEEPATVAAPATQPAPAPAAAAAPAAAEPEKVAAPAAPTLDQQVAEKLKAALAKNKREKGLDAYYAARDYAPLWVVDGALGARAKAAAGYLAKVDADGLDPSDYPLPDIKAGNDPAALADAEIKFSTSVVTFARHASQGRVHYSRVSADVYYPPVAFDAGETLGKIANAKDAAAALDGFNPPQAGYKALKAKLADARAAKGDANANRLAHGPTLTLGKTIMSDPRVPQLRERLGLAAVPHDTFYDKPLADAVKKFQQKRGLPASGSLTNATVDAINGPRRDRDADIILANMERWRWLPRDLGKAYVMLNIPNFTLKVMNNGQQVWTTRVVTGKATTPTPILSETMKYITVNPTWNVPPSIVYNEYLPALKQDPTVLDRMGLKLTQNRDGSVHISQPPGEKNALGRIRFNFPNKFLVYQHDTPDKHLFAHDKRAYSHGCMRVQDPAKYAEVLLGIALPNEGYSQDRIQKMYGSGERDIKFPTPIPVHITYQTAFVDEAGKLQIREDVYGRDARVLAALKGDDRRMADVPMERAQPNYSRPSVQLPERYAHAGNSGPSFFERLFGGGSPAPEAAPPRPRRNVGR